MALPAIGDTQLTDTKAELISEIAQRALVAAAVIMPSVRDVSAFARKGAESVSFPNRQTFFTVLNRASGAEAVNQQELFGKDTMPLSFRSNITWVVDPNDEIESSLDVQKELIEDASKLHAEDVDTNIIAEMEAAGIPTTTAGDISQAVVLEMRAVLLKNKATPGELWLAVDPDQEANLLQIDPFISADQYGRAIVPQGVLGTLYGVKVISTPLLGSTQYFMYERAGLGVGFQKRATFDERKAPENGAGAMLQTIELKYGVKALQVDVAGATDAGGAPLASESALIVRDNNV